MLLVRRKTSTIFMEEMISRQLEHIDTHYKLDRNDIKRILKHLESSIFHDTCSLWNGYITNNYNPRKMSYVNYYFNNQKTALHRLLYANYVGSLSVDEYIKYSCVNRAFCCCLKHMTKHEYKAKTFKGPKYKKIIIDSFDVDFNT